MLRFVAVRHAPTRFILPPIAVVVWAAVAACGGRTGDLSASAAPDGGHGLGGSGGVHRGSGGAGRGAVSGYSGGGYGGFVASGGYYPGTGGGAAAGGSGGGPTCLGVACPAIQCGGGFQQVDLPDSCCPSCEPCTEPCASIGFCAPGYESQLLPGECCPTCVACPPCPPPDCGPDGTLTDVGQCCPVCTVTDPCAGVDCGPCPLGYDPVFSPGACCPSCVPAAVDGSVGSCDQAGYAAFVVKEEAALDALSCDTDSDCTVISPGAACQSGCGMAVNGQSAMALYGAASQFAAMACFGCPPTAGGACPVMVSLCVNAECTLVVRPEPL